MKKSKVIITLKKIQRQTESVLGDVRQETEARGRLDNDDYGEEGTTVY